MSPFAIIDSIHPSMFAVMLGISVLCIIGAMLGLPLLVLRLPADYFTHDRRIPAPMKASLLRLVLLVLKNAMGIVLVLAGILMLVLPGQGLLTILGGILLLDFPGKYRIERFLASRKRIAITLNWIRRRGDKPPFETLHVPGG